jgi:putative ABC transport system ATP-binding protein
MPLVTIRDLHKKYISGKNVETQALCGVDLDIEKGEFLAIAGPSGSGKSSLLHIIGALDVPTSGSVTYDDKDITRSSASELAMFRLKEVGFIFQAYNLIATLTAVENVEYVMLLQGVEPQLRRNRAVDILQKVGLGNYIHRFPSEMSGGQQQRVAVARAIVPEPGLIIADEPTANLDSRTAAELLDLMAGLNQEKGITFVFSTHDKMVMDKARRIVYLKDGLITN